MQVQIIYKPTQETTFTQCKRIWNAIQRQKAKASISRADRKKTTLTDKQILNKWCQMGNAVKCGKIIYTYKRDIGLGLLITPDNMVLGATIDDFFALMQK